MEEEQRRREEERENYLVADKKLNITVAEKDDLTSRWLFSKFYSIKKCVYNKHKRKMLL